MGADIRGHLSLKTGLLQRELHCKVRDIERHSNAAKDSRPALHLALWLVRVHPSGMQVLLQPPPGTAQHSKEYKYNGPDENK